MHALAFLLLTFTAENCATDWSVVKGRTAWARQEAGGWVVFDVNAENIRLAKDGIWYIVPPRDPAMWHWADWESALEFVRQHKDSKCDCAVLGIDPCDCTPGNTCGCKCNLALRSPYVRPTQSSGCANGSCRVRRGRR